MTSNEKASADRATRLAGEGEACRSACLTSRVADCARLARRGVIVLGVALLVLGSSTSPVHAFGEDGAFNPRVLLTGTAKFKGIRARAPARWSMEVVRRTSAPARLAPAPVRADDPKLIQEPFVIWAGAKPAEPLTRSELRGLRRFLALGGVLLVDDSDPKSGRFLRSAKRELQRILPGSSVIEIGPENVIFRSYYLLRRAVGRTTGNGKLQAIVQRGAVRVVLSPYDLLGALARQPGGVHPLDVEPGGEVQREHAVRLAVNVAMYLLCSDYKDDQVHAPALMRRRAMEQP